MPDPILLCSALLVAHLVFLTLSVLMFRRTRRYMLETRGNAAYVRIWRNAANGKKGAHEPLPATLPFVRPKPLRIADPGDSA